MCLKGCIELSVAMTSFVRQLQATDKFLGQIACLSTAADVQRQRVKILVDIIPHRGPWTSDACSFACEAVNSCQNLTKENKEALLQSICQLVDDEIEAGSRVKLQDYTNVVNMLPQDLSGLLVEETMPHRGQTASSLTPLSLTRITLSFREDMLSVDLLGLLVSLAALHARCETQELVLEPDQAYDQAVPPALPKYIFFVTRESASSLAHESG